MAPRFAASGLAGNATLALALALATCGAARAQDSIDPALAIDIYATGFTSPSFMRFLPDAAPGHIEFLVGEIGIGRVLHYRDGVFVGVAADFAVAFLFERGLFGLALHPDFDSEPWVYAYYTASATGTDTSAADGALDNRVVRMRWNGATLDSLQVLLQLPVGPNHNGGALGFGPDGMLYGSIGEAGSTQGQMQNNAGGVAPNRTSMIFRIAPDGSIPTDNPFAALGDGISPAYAYGLRNVFGIDFDPIAGALWATDNGAALYDEILRVPAAGNGGWSRISGPVARDAEGVADLWMAPGAAYFDPQFSFRQSFGITAIHFQRGTMLGSHYEGDAFVAAHNSMTIYRFDLTPDRTALVMPDSTLDDLVADDLSERDRVLWATGVGVVTDMETGPDGALYVLRFSSPSTLYRVARRTTASVNSQTRRTVLAVWPNPARGEVRVAGIGDAPLGPLRIVDAAGRVVRRLPGAAALVTWDRRDRLGRPVAAGRYWIQGSGGAAAPVVLLP